MADLRDFGTVPVSSEVLIISVMKGRRAERQSREKLEEDRVHRF